MVLSKYNTAIPVTNWQSILSLVLVSPEIVYYLWSHLPLVFLLLVPYRSILSFFIYNIFVPIGAATIQTWHCQSRTTRSVISLPPVYFCSLRSVSVNVINTTYRTAMTKHKTHSNDDTANLNHELTVSPLISVLFGLCRSVGYYNVINTIPQLYDTTHHELPQSHSYRYFLSSSVEFDPCRPVNTKSRCPVTDRCCHRIVLLSDFFPPKSQCSVQFHFRLV